MQRIDLSHKLCDKLVFGPVVDIFRPADLNEFALIQDSDAVTHHHRLFQGMSDVDKGLSCLPMNVLEFFFKCFSKSIVQGGQRFIEKQDLGIKRQCPCKRDPLTLPAGTLVDTLAIKILRQAQQIQQFIGALASGRWRNTGNLHCKLNVLSHSFMREQCKVLENHARWASIRGDTIDDFPIQGNFATGGVFHPHQYANHGSFTATGRTDQREKLPFGNAEVYVSKCCEFTELLCNTS